MSLLEELNKLSPESHKELIRFYESHRFPIEIRNLFPKEIQDAVCGVGGESLDGGLDPTNSDHFLPISEFLSKLIHNLELKLVSNQLPFFIRHKFNEARTDFKSRFEESPIDLFASIRSCISLELDLIRSSKISGGILTCNSSSVDIINIMEEVVVLRGGILTCAEILTRVGMEQESFEINCNQRQTMDDYLSKVQNVKMTKPNPQTASFEKTVTEKISFLDKKLQENVSTLLSVMESFESSMNSCVLDLSKLVKQIESSINSWKYEQQLSLNGVKSNLNLSLKTLQLNCEELADLIWSTRQQLKEAERLQNLNPILTSNSPSRNVGVLIEEVTGLLSKLLQKSFVVENQPPQVMKLGTKFPCPLTVSLLVGNRLNIAMTAPLVQTNIISEAQARAFHDRSGSTGSLSSGDICNGVSKLELDRASSRLLSNFRSIQLKRIRRSEKKGGAAEGSVMEEKFCLHFKTVVGVGELSFQIHALSAPLVVISHGSQEAQAVATTAWDNAFALPTRIPFAVTQKVQWVELAEILSTRMCLATGRGLNADQLDCLKQKAIRKGREDSISWCEFCKENLVDRNFSFWDWFYAALKVLEKKETNLKEIWKDGLIHGFIERQKAEALLVHKQAGTFLLRFSDSLPGAITIAWVHEDGKVYLVNPFQASDLQMRRLADSVKELEKLKFLYPDVSRDAAFGRHYSPPPSLPPSNKLPYVTLKQTLNVPTQPSHSNSSSSWEHEPMGATTPSCHPQEEQNWDFSSVAQLDASFQNILMMDMDSTGRNEMIPSDLSEALGSIDIPSGVDEPMQIPMEDQFEDLLQVIGEQDWSTFK